MARLFIGYLSGHRTGIPREPPGRFPLTRFQVNFRTVQMGNALHDRQTQTRAIHPVCQPVKRCKNSCTLRLWNARPIVCHPPCHALFRAAYRQRNSHPAIAQDIVDQIGEHLPQQMGFVVYCIKADFHPLFQRLRNPSTRDFPYPFCSVQRNQAKGVFCCIDALQKEQLLNQFTHGSGPDHRFDALVKFFFTEIVQATP